VRGKEKEANWRPILCGGGGRRCTVAHDAVAPARPMTARATEVGDEQGSGPSGLRRPESSWVRVGQVDRVVLAGLAWNRKKEARDGLG
jgi:hypothetical protein